MNIIRLSKGFHRLATRYPQVYAQANPLIIKRLLNKYGLKGLSYYYYYLIYLSIKICI